MHMGVVDVEGQRLVRGQIDTVADTRWHGRERPWFHFDAHQHHMSVDRGFPNHFRMNSEAPYAPFEPVIPETSQAAKGRPPGCLNLQLTEALD